MCQAARTAPPDPAISSSSFTSLLSSPPRPSRRHHHHYHHHPRRPIEHPDKRPPLPANGHLQMHCYLEPCQAVASALEPPHGPCMRAILGNTLVFPWQRQQTASLQIQTDLSQATFFPFFPSFPSFPWVRYQDPDRTKSSLFALRTATSDCYPITRPTANFLISPASLPLHPPLRLLFLTVFTVNSYLCSTQFRVSSICFPRSYSRSPLSRAQGRRERGGLSTFLCYLFATEPPSTTSKP
jgi:hypothetical protein